MHNNIRLVVLVASAVGLCACGPPGGTASADTKNPPSTLSAAAEPPRTGTPKVARPSTPNENPVIATGGFGDNGASASEDGSHAAASVTQSGGRMPSDRPLVSPPSPRPVNTGDPAPHQR